MSHKELKTVGARCIVKEKAAEEQTASGILIAGTSAQERTYTGEVLVVGDGAYLENGTVKPMSVKTGDIVMFAKYSGTPIKYKNEEYIILNERDILVIVSESNE